MAVLGASGKSIKSVQRGQSLVSQNNYNSNVGINAVDTAKSFVTCSTSTGQYWSYNFHVQNSSAYFYGQGHVSAYLSSSTNVNFTNSQTYSYYTGSGNSEISWEVIEFE